MSLNTNINLQSILTNLGQAYNNETGASSITTTLSNASGPVYDVSLARNTVSGYLSGNAPLNQNDFNILNNFATSLSGFETNITGLYSNLKSNFLSLQFQQLNSFINTAYGTDIRSYLNTYSYTTNTGPVYDIHGGFAQSYLDNNNQSLIFKVAEITFDGTNALMTFGPLNYRGTSGYNKITSFTGPAINIVDENIATTIINGPNNSTIEYGTTGSVSLNFIIGQNSKTLVYPRLNDAGYATSGPTGVTIGSTTINFTQQPIFRKAPGINSFLIKATNVFDSGYRNFVFKMVNQNVNKATVANTDTSQIITVAGTGSTKSIIGTNGNSSYYRPFSLVSASNLQIGEVFEIWSY